MIVAYHKNFTKRLVRLSPKIQAAFYKKLEIFYNNRYDKRLNNHALHGVFAGSRSIDVTGNYRAVFVENADSVIFTVIGTHPELYE